MDSKQMNALVMVTTIALLLVNSIDTHQLDNGHWEQAHATFYGDISGNETKQGACGYRNVFEEGYGLETTALSGALFNGGLTCGACYEIKCYNSQWCLNSRRTIHVTATNLCPANYTKADDHWCNPPLKHFDLTQPMFRSIAVYRGGIVPVLYRRVLCHKRGGVKFMLSGNDYWINVLVYNVGGAGDVHMVKIKSSGTDWIPLNHDWGQVWIISYSKPKLMTQSLSFQVTTSDGKMVQADNVVPPNWQFNVTYEATNQFNVEND